MKPFLQKLQTLEHTKGDLNYSYSFKDNTLLLFKERKRGKDATTDGKIAFVRVNYIPSRGVWKIYTMYNLTDWKVYKPQAEAKTLEQVLRLVEEDKYSLFFG